MSVQFRKSFFRFGLLVLSVFLHGCVGGTALTSHEGIWLDSKNNSYEKPSEFESIFLGYSTRNKNDPGNPVHLNAEGNEIEIQANCINNRVVSFIPSFVIPFPPIIPWFGKGDGVVDETLVLTQILCSVDDYEIEYLEKNGEIYTPSKIENCAYSFPLACSSLERGGKVHLNNGSNEIIIDIIYKKTFNIGWAWLAA